MPTERNKNAAFRITKSNGLLYIEITKASKEHIKQQIAASKNLNFIENIIISYLCLLWFSRPQKMLLQLRPN